MNHELANKQNVYVDEYGQKWYVAGKPVQSLYGTMTSFGTKTPKEWLDGLMKILYKTKTMRDLIILLRRQDSILIRGKDYGFGKNDYLVSHLLEAYELLDRR